MDAAWAEASVPPALARERGAELRAARRDDVDQPVLLQRRDATVLSEGDLTMDYDSNCGFQLLTRSEV